MASIRFPQFLRRYGITLLFVSTTDVIPGAIIEKKKKSFFPIGRLHQIFGDPAADWATELKDANFAYGTVERSLSLKGKSSLTEFGVDVSGGLRRAKKVKFGITNVICRSFETQNKLTIIPRLNTLRLTDKATWDLVNDKWIADYTYYASEVTFDFDVDAGVDLKAEIENKINLSADAGIEWTSKRSFTITKNQNVPFGFSGWRV
jgi:hypothetical protein